jgi:hypothetical protein
MTVYVDELFTATPRIAQVRYHGMRWCHLTADTLDELHEFAAKLGLKREWFQGHHRNPAFWHYDLTANKRVQAVRLGAKELTWREAAEKRNKAMGEGRKT